MGLDQYAYTRDAEEEAGENCENNNEIAQWRKHNRLHGWMEQLYRDRGNPVTSNGFGTDFNCVELELTESDIEQLEAHIENRALPETGGFFFGGDSYAEYENPDWGYKEQDLDFIREARQAFATGKKVFYNSWW